MVIDKKNLTDNGEGYANSQWVSRRTSSRATVSLFIFAIINPGKCILFNNLCGRRYLSIYPLLKINSCLIVQSTGKETQIEICNILIILKKLGYTKLERNLKPHRVLGFRLYTANGRVSRENLVLRSSVLHFSPDEALFSGRIGNTAFCLFNRTMKFKY